LLNVECCDGRIRPSLDNQQSTLNSPGRESFMSLRYPILLIAAMLAAASGAGAQLALPAPDPANKDARQGVYVRDSAVAAEKLALAQRMERLKEWDKSADVYQEIVEKYADRVVPIGGEGNEKRYSSVTLAVQDLLGKWPEEGLAAYRARYETPAATMLEAAGTEDISALNRVVQRYFPTDAAKTAGLRLTEIYIENGEFAAAAWLGERLPPIARSCCSARHSRSIWPVTMPPPSRSWTSSNRSTPLPSAWCAGRKSFSPAS
jgi:hypothetical protein